MLQDRENGDTAIKDVLYLVHRQLHRPVHGHHGHSVVLHVGEESRQEEAISVKEEEGNATPIDHVLHQVLQQQRGPHCHGLHGPVAVLPVEEDHNREQEVMEEFKLKAAISTSVL